jgi:hypothetical protein
MLAAGMDMPLKVLVTGGRDYHDIKTIAAWLDGIHDDFQIRQVIEGGADGADRHAREWALRHGVKVITYVADWETYGRAAGVRRNTRMLEESEPDLVLAFPGGRGTADMVRKARKKKVDLVLVPDPEVN